MFSGNSTFYKIISGDIELTDKNFIQAVVKVVSEIETQGLLTLIYWLIFLILLLFGIITLLQVCNLTCTVIGRKKNKKYYQQLQNNGIQV